MCLRLFTESLRFGLGATCPWAKPYTPRSCAQNSPEVILNRRGAINRTHTSRTLLIRTTKNLKSKDAPITAIKQKPATLASSVSFLVEGLFGVSSSVTVPCFRVFSLGICILYIYIYVHI